MSDLERICDFACVWHSQTLPWLIDPMSAYASRSINCLKRVSWLLLGVLFEQTASTTTCVTAQIYVRPIMNRSMSKQEKNNYATIHCSIWHIMVFVQAYCSFSNKYRNKYNDMTLGKILYAFGWVSWVFVSHYTLYIYITDCRPDETRN